MTSPMEWMNEDGGELAARHFVGALLHMPPAVVLEAAAVIFPEWVTDQQVAGVYSAICENAEAEISEPAAVVPTMLRLGLPQHKHGMATGLVVDLYTECPVPANWRFYAVLTATARMRTRVQVCGQTLADEAHRATLDRLHAILSDAREELEAMQNHILQLSRGESAG